MSAGTAVRYMVHVFILLNTLPKFTTQNVTTTQLMINISTINATTPIATTTASTTTTTSTTSTPKVIVTTKENDEIRFETISIKGGETSRENFVDGLIARLSSSRTTRLPGDHVFLVDISGSVYDGREEDLEDFFEKTLMKFVRDGFLVHPDYARVAVVTFADEVKVTLDGISMSAPPYTACDLFSDSNGLWDEIELEDKGTNTRITDGLKRAEEILNSGLRSRPGKVWRQTVWIYTDGWDSHGVEFGNSTTQVTERLKARGTEIFSVALPSTYMNTGNVKRLVHNASHHISYTEWQSLASSDKLLPRLKGTESRLAAPAGNCSLAERCGENASCFCDCLTVAFMCACDPEFQPNGDQCAKCGEMEHKTEAGNHSCASCATVYNEMCPDRSFEVSHGLAVALVIISAIGFTGVIIFLLVYTLAVIRDRKRTPRSPPPGRDELDCPQSPIQTAENAPQPRGAHGYTNRDMLAFYPDVVRAAHEHSKSMKGAIDVNSARGSPAPCSPALNATRHAHSPESNRNLHTDDNMIDLARYSPSPASSPRSPTSLNYYAEGDNYSPTSTTSYMVPVLPSPSAFSGKCSPPPADGGYMTPIDPDSDADEYVNASVVSLNKPENLLSGEYLTPRDAKLTKAHSTDDTDDDSYVNESEIQEINLSVQKLIKSEKAGKNKVNLAKQLKPVPASRPKWKADQTESSSQLTTNQNVKKIKPIQIFQPNHKTEQSEHSNEHSTNLNLKKLKPVKVLQPNRKPEQGENSIEQATNQQFTKLKPVPVSQPNRKIELGENSNEQTTNQNFQKLKPVPVLQPARKPVQGENSNQQTENHNFRKLKPISVSQPNHKAEQVGNSNEQTTNQNFKKLKPVAVLQPYRKPEQGENSNQHTANQNVKKLKRIPFSQPNHIVEQIGNSNQRNTNENMTTREGSVKPKAGTVAQLKDALFSSTDGLSSPFPQSKGAGKRSPSSPKTATGDIINPTYVGER